MQPRALAEKASLTLAEVEAATRAEFDEEFDGTPEREPDLPLWGMFVIEMPNGVEFIAWVHDPKSPVEVDAVAGYADGPRLGEETAEWLDMKPGPTMFPIGATKR
jgi:hypothetical protein